VAIDVSRTTIVQWAIATLADPETSKANASLLLPFVVRSLSGRLPTANSRSHSRDYRRRVKRQFGASF
jgi:hypothetical protein